MGDIDGDNHISYEELISATYGHHVQDERLYEQFTALDVNGDGFITMEELEAGLTAQLDKAKSEGVDLHFSLEDAKKALQEVDTNSDGRIDYNEFLAAIYPEINEKFEVPDLDDEERDSGGPPTLKKKS